MLLVSVVSVAWSATLGATPASAAINKQVNFQGRLTDPSGNAVADGIYNLEFKLHNHATNAGGVQGACAASCLWMETRTAGNRVTVTRGLFAVQLGEITSLAAFNFNQDPLYLSVRVGGTPLAPVWDTEMTPRHRLGAAPTAIYADSAGAAAPTGTAGGDLTGNYPNPTITTDAVGSNEVALDALTAADLAAGSVGTSEIADNTVTSTDILDATITATDLAANSVDASEIVDGAVGTAEVALDSLTAADLAAGSVGTSEIADNTVSSTDILDDTISAADLAAGSVGTSEIADNTVSGTDILDNTIGAADLAAGSVGTSEIADGTVGYADEATKPTAGAARVTNQTFTNSVYALISFPVQSWDTWDCCTSMFAAGGTAIYARVPGVYLATGQASWAADANGKRHFILTHRDGGGGNINEYKSQIGAIGAETQHGATGTFYMAAGDYVVINAQQNSGGNLAVVEADMALTWIAPL